VSAIHGRDVIRGIVFDFDGLIIASETVAVRSWQDLYARFGVTLPLEQWVTLIGTWDAPWSPGAHLRELVGDDHDWDAIERDRREAELAHALALPPLPGVLDRLDDARRLGLPLAIASSSDRGWVAGHLDRLGIADRFDAVVTRDDVERTKPDPELFVRAMQALALAPADTLAFEDSLHGVIAAKSAGMRCVAVPNPLLTGEDYSAADLVVDSLAEHTLEELIGRVWGHTA
jgi:HAD superfamily hydrolase (TIGR01509 family)